MKSSYQGGRAEIYNLQVDPRGTGAYTLKCMSIEGRPTANVADIHQHLKTQWFTIFRKLDSRSPAEWSVSHDRYASLFESCFVSCILDPINAAHVAEAIKTWKSSSAAGTDGWYPDEWKAHAVISLLLKPDADGSAF